MFRTLFVAVAVFTVGCASKGSTGPEGTSGPRGAEGPNGTVGPQGPVGPQGVQGPAGPATVSLQSIPAGSACPNGGVLLQDADGGQAAVCNGTNGQAGQQGTAGQTGATGATGATGMQGVAGPSSLALFDVDGGRIGSISPTDARWVFIESVNCFGSVDNTDNVITPNGYNGSTVSGSMGFTGMNCTGTTVVKATDINLGCASYNGNVYRMMQPAVLQTVTIQSYGNSQVYADGGVQTNTCTNTNQPGQQAFVMEQIQFPTITGPFSWGVR